MKLLPRHLAFNLAPLLLSLAVSQSYATEILIVGQDGFSGRSATTFGANGGDGGAAPDLFHALAQTPPDRVLSLTVRGGAGGAGGQGGAYDGGVDGSNGGGGGRGGHGGSGALATGRASSTADVLDLVVRSLVFGGAGGASGNGGGVCAAPSSYADCVANGMPFGAGASGAAGEGGAAFSEARALTGGAGNIDVSAYARGGNAGGVDYSYAKPGLTTANGGGADSRAYGQSDTGSVRVAAEAYGGHASIGGNGGSVELNNAVAGSTRGELTLFQRAVGGDAGSGLVDGEFRPVPVPAASGDAVSRLSLTDAAASALTAHVSAVGGNAGVGEVRGGAAFAGLTLASTRDGAALNGVVEASGGTGGGLYNSPGGVGGAADAAAHLTGRGNVTGSATATGGVGGRSYDGFSAGVGGGNASATLTLEGAGLATGGAAAYGGKPGASDTFYWDAPREGNSSAALSLAGAGALGTAYAEGDSAGGAVSSRTSGALAVNVGATARSRNGEAVARVDVASGVGAVLGGYGNVTARASAASISGDAYGNFSGAVTSQLDVRASGAIDAISEARSGDTRSGQSPYNFSGVAGSSARGVTTGNHAVSLRAFAQAGASQFVEPGGASSSGASATAFGQSGRGAVDVSAEARASDGAFVNEYDSYGRVSAAATAINLERGGRGAAHAVVWGGSGDVLASASGIGRDGRALRVGATATSLMQGWRRALDGSAVASNYFEASAFQLATASGTGALMVSNVGAAPDTIAAMGALGPLGPVVTAGMSSLVGVGMQGYANNPTEYGTLIGEFIMPTASGRFEFDGAAGQHLLLGLVSASLGGAFDSIELSVTNHGVGLFSRTFTSADEAFRFFNGQVLDLGLLGAGMQDVLVSTMYGSSGNSLFSFNYLVGTGAGVTAVPEASTWLMLVLGLGAVTIVARRRRRA